MCVQYNSLRESAGSWHVATNHKGKEYVIEMRRGPEVMLPTPHPLYQSISVGIGRIDHLALSPITVIVVHNDATGDGYFVEKPYSRSATLDLEHVLVFADSGDSSKRVLRYPWREYTEILILQDFGLLQKATRPDPHLPSMSLLRLAAATRWKSGVAKWILSVGSAVSGFAISVLVLTKGESGLGIASLGGKLCVIGGALIPLSVIGVGAKYFLARLESLLLDRFAKSRMCPRSWKPYIDNDLQGTIKNVVRTIHHYNMTAQMLTLEESQIYRDSIKCLAEYR